MTFSLYHKEFYISPINELFNDPFIEIIVIGMQWAEDGNTVYNIFLLGCLQNSQVLFKIQHLRFLTNTGPTILETFSTWLL